MTTDNHTQNTKITLIPKPDTDDFTYVEFDYLTNDIYDDKWIENTKKILLKCIKKMPFYKFLKLVFSNSKTQMYIRLDRELVTVSLEICTNVLNRLYSYCLTDAPQDILDIVEKPSYTTDLKDQVQILKYVLSTIKSPSLANEIKNLVHYHYILSLMYKQ
jgi:hypothetical protein